MGRGFGVPKKKRPGIKAPKATTKHVRQARERRTGMRVVGEGTLLCVWATHGLPSEVACSVDIPGIKNTSTTERRNTARGHAQRHLAAGEEEAHGFCVLAALKGGPTRLGSDHPSVFARISPEHRQGKKWASPSPPPLLPFPCQSLHHPPPPWPATAPAVCPGARGAFPGRAWGLPRVLPRHQIRGPSLNDLQLNSQPTAPKTMNSNAAAAAPAAAGAGGRARRVTKKPGWLQDNNIVTEVGTPLSLLLTGAMGTLFVRAVLQCSCLPPPAPRPPTHPSTHPPVCPARVTGWVSRPKAPTRLGGPCIPSNPPTQPNPPAPHTQPNPPTHLPTHPNAVREIRPRHQQPRASRPRALAQDHAAEPPILFLLCRLLLCLRRRLRPQATQAKATAAAAAALPHPLLLLLLLLLLFLLLLFRRRLPPVIPFLLPFLRTQYLSPNLCSSSRAPPTHPPPSPAGRRRRRRRRRRR